MMKLRLGVIIFTLTLVSFGFQAQGKTSLDWYLSGDYSTALKSLATETQVHQFSPHELEQRIELALKIYQQSRLIKSEDVTAILTQFAKQESAGVIRPTAIQYLEEWKRGLKLDRPDIAQWMRQGAKIEKMSDPLLKPNHVRRARIKVLQSMALHQSLIPKQSMDWIYMAGYYDSLAGKMESPYLQRVLNSSDVSEGFKNQTRRLLQKMKARHRQSASSEFNSGRTQ